MKFNAIPYCLAFLTLASPAAGAALPQDQTGSRQEESVDDDVLPMTPVVMVRVEVSDRRGKAVAGLREEDFAVYENGVRRQVVFVERGPSEATGLGTHQYRVAYILKGKRDGGYRRIRVALPKRIRSGLKVKSYPDGFFARERGRP
jgi:hypothetical protein